MPEDNRAIEDLAIPPALSEALQPASDEQLRRTADKIMAEFGMSYSQEDGMTSTEMKCNECGHEWTAVHDESVDPTKVCKCVHADCKSDNVWYAKKKQNEEEAEAEASE